MRWLPRRIGLLGSAAARLQTRFWRDRRGGVAIFAAAAIIPLLGALGLATDVSRAYLVKSRLQDAVDAAALAGGKVITSSTRDADIQTYFTANFPVGFMQAVDATTGAATPVPVISDNHTANAAATTVTVTASARIPTTFMRILGFDDITVSATATATRAMAGLDVVLAMDVSGSMGMPMSKMDAAQSAAKSLVEYLFDGAATSPTTVVNGTTYYLLNIGLVPWNHHVRVTRNGVAFSSVTTQSVAAFTNPFTGTSQSTLYYANNSPVPLLWDPRCWNRTNCSSSSNRDSTWSGAVYARYIDDGDNGNDGDFVLGQATVGGKSWMGWEPAPDRWSQPRSGDWTSTTGGYQGGHNWTGDPRQCYAVYWSNTTLDDSSYPAEVPNRNAGTTGSSTRTTWTYPNPSYNSTWSDCMGAPAQGITDLTHTKSTIENAIDELSPAGGTIIPGGLYWAWEVVTPGGPYNAAVASPPFPRAQAIVLFTDGKNESYFGDGYKMTFGYDTNGATSTTHGYLPQPPAATPTTYNNLNNRLIAMATAIKTAGVRIYVVKYQDNDANNTAVLKQVASGPSAPYYFDAADSGQLQDAFQQIAADLSKLRLSK
ncbi:MAG: hypothetical protein IRY94_03105 [Rhodospirillaceae bacterium]|nr:hypothetical protein [Rhodospirillaceae bacterium]